MLSGFAILAAMAFLATRTEAQPGQTNLIVPGVWFREGDLANLGHCNNIIIEMQDYLIVVDANFPSGARLALETAHRISPKPVKYVFDTHHHGDHAYGNPIWTKAGATTLAYVGVAEEMKRFEPARWQAAAKQRPDVAELHRDAPEPPQQTFDKSPFTLKDGSREVRFYFFGWAHTRGDGFVYLPREKVLCTGDAVVNGPYNFTADADVGNWPKVVRSVRALTTDLRSSRPRSVRRPRNPRRPDEVHDRAAQGRRRHHQTREEVRGCGTARHHHGLRQRGPRQDHAHSSRQREELDGPVPARPGPRHLGRDCAEEAPRRYPALDVG